MPSKPGPAEVWPCSNARRLAETVREAGGGITRLGQGLVKVTGPHGAVIVDEPTAKDESGPLRLAQIAEVTGLRFG